MKKYAIIVAGGEGTRLGGGLPKQFRNLKGRPVLWWSLKAFHDEDPSTEIRVVVHPGFFDDWSLLFEELPEDERIPHIVVCGGRSRTESVKNGLEGVPPERESLVAVHDAARPLVTADLIRLGWETAAEKGGAVPAVPVTDSLRLLTDDGSRSVDRSDYVAVQTPQVFNAEMLKNAYTINPDAVYSDDASAFEAAGHNVALFKGSPSNIKITNPGDIEIASILMDELSRH